MSTEERLGEYRGFSLSVTNDGHNFTYLARKKFLTVDYASQYGLDDLKRLIDEGEGE